MNLLNSTPEQVFTLLQQHSQSGIQQHIPGPDGKPMAAVIYVMGQTETPAVLAAVDGVTDQWRDESHIAADEPEAIISPMEHVKDAMDDYVRHLASDTGTPELDAGFVNDVLVRAAAFLYGEEGPAQIQELIKARAARLGLDVEADSPGKADSCEAALEAGEPTAIDIAPAPAWQSS